MDKKKISHSPSVIGRNDQNQSNKQRNFNLKHCGPKGRNKNAEKLRMPSTLISRVKQKFHPKTDVNAIRK